MKLPGSCQGKKYRTRGAEIGYAIPNPDRPQLNIEDLWMRFALSYLKLKEYPVDNKLSLWRREAPKT